MTTPRTVLILGARGRFGLAAARAFAQAGWQVRAQVRPGRPTADQLSIIPGVTRLPIALDDQQALLAAADGVSVVVHALNPLYTNAQWRTVAPALLAQSIALCRASRACLMLPGNVYNYGENMPDVLREDSPQHANTVKGQARIAMEQRLAQACADGQMQALVIRAGDFFGSGTGSWLDQAMLPKVPKGLFTYPGSMDTPRAWAYLPDLAKTFVAVAEKRADLPAFDTFHFSGYQLTGRDWVNALTPAARAQGWIKPDGELKLGGMPWSLIRMGAIFMPVWASLLEMRYLWDCAHRLDNAKLVALLGSEPHTTLPAALRSSLQDLSLLGAATSEPSDLPSHVTR